MQALLASLVIGMSVKDAAFRSAMAANRAEVRKTGQDFERGADRMGGAMEAAFQTVNAAAIRIADSVRSIGNTVQQQGLRLTAGLTLPLGLLGHAAKDTASDFQSAMNAVHSAMVNVDPAQLEKLRDAALTMGPAMGRSAVEAANAIEALAKNGMDAAAILDGGLTSALRLAVVGQTDLGKAADLTTDLQAQFNQTAADLPITVDRVAGALDASKMAFDDYRLAAGQAGGLVGALGYTFEDFNTALAATAPLFDSGSDAGTSFRTFLTSLNAKSKDAERTMEKLGLSFYNADGSARPLAEIADELQRKLGNLNDRSKNSALQNLFGVDGARTALALMKLGFQGVEDARKSIAAVTADQKLAILLEGEAAATQRLAGSWEKLKISIGNAGIIQAYTGIKEAGAAMLATIGAAPPWFFKLVVAAGAGAAALGPLTLAALGLAKIALPLLLLRLGPVALGMAAIINPAGVLLRVLGQLALQAGAATMIGRFGGALIGAAGPIGLVITLLGIAVPLLLRAGQASDAARTAGERLASTNAAVATAAQTLVTAEGKARDAILAKAKADRIAAVDAIKKAKADMVAARAALARANAAADDNVRAAASASGPMSVFGLPGLAGGFAANVAARLGGNLAVKDARADLQQRVDNTKAAIANFDAIDALISNAGTGAAPKVEVDFDDPEKKKRTKKDRTAQNTAAYEDELGQSRVALLDAQADLTGSYEARYVAEMAAIAEERASYIRRNAVDEGLTDARRAALLAAKDDELGKRRLIVEQDRSIAAAQEAFDLATAANAQAQDRARGEIDLADSFAGRRDAEMRLLDLQRQQEGAELDLILATKATASAEWANAAQRKDALGDIYAARREQIARQTESPGAGYLRWLDRSDVARTEDMQAAQVDALRDLNLGLTDALLGTRKLGDAFVGMGRRIIGSLMDIAIQQAVIKPLAQNLLGGGGGGGGLLSLLGLGGRGAALAGGIAGPASLGTSSIGFGQIALPNFGGFRKDGGPIAANDWYIVGEEGPEVFAPGVSGTVIPNGGLGSGRRSPAVVQIAVDEGALFRPTVRAISGEVTVEAAGASDRARSRAARRRLA